MIKRCKILGFLIILIFFRNLKPVEGGLSTCPLGYRVINSGKLSLPGFLLRDDIFYVNAHSSKKIDNSQIHFNCSMSSAINLLNLTYVFKSKFLGANLGLSVVLPIVFPHIDYEVYYPSSILKMSGSQPGYGDTGLSLTLGWHCKKSLHFLLAGLFVFPTGKFDVNRVGNVGRNRYAIDPELGITLLDSKGKWELSAVAGLTFNFQNRKTRYKSGRELHLEYNLSNNFRSGFMVGLGGYYYEQTTADSGEGAFLGEYRGRLYGLGPIFSFTKRTKKHVLSFVFKYFHDLEAKNHFKGERFFFEGVYKF